MSCLARLQSQERGTAAIRQLLLSAAAVALGTAAAAPAQAQIEEITVTARKVEENLRDIPLQVTAVTIATIKDVNMTTPRDINALSPGLNWQSGTGSRLGAGRLFF